MVRFWDALATRDTRMMSHVLRSHFPTRLTNATHATHIRCHDDIGWTVTDKDAAHLGLSGAAHRAYLSDFHGGSFPGSFARGALFQVNEATGGTLFRGIRHLRRAATGACAQPLVSVQLLEPLDASARRLGARTGRPAPVRRIV